MDRSWAEAIEENPIAGGLDGFRASLSSSVADISDTSAALGQLSRDQLQNLVLTLLSALQVHPAARILRASSGKSLFIEISRLNAAVATDHFDLDHVQSFLKAAINKADDLDIWEQVKNAVAETTPPPRPAASSIQQTPWLRNTSSFPNSSEYRKHVDGVLKEELGLMYVGIPNFWNVYFGGIDDLETASEMFFKQCMGGSSRMFDDGWTAWPSEAREDDVLDWFTDFYQKLTAFAADRRPSLSRQRRSLAKPNKPIDGSVGKRKLDIGFVNDPEAQKDTKCHWSQILVPGELKSNASADKAAEAWLDLGRYAREVFAAQDTRRFVLGFIIYGSLMRVWVFDRLGGIAAEQFDINNNGFQFVYAILGFTWMSEEQLGFDPTIQKVNDERFIQIERKGSKQRVIIDDVVLRGRCIAGRATTCWRAHPEGHPETRLVIKDSWQYPERDEEGEMLCEVTDKGIINVARYYHHETVQIRGADGDIRHNVRRGLDMATASNYRQGRPQQPREMASEGPRNSRTTSRKRPSSQTDSTLPPSKRSCSTSPTEAASTPLNRVHRRVIVKDYGKPIYEAASRQALLTAFEGCIEGHRSLRDAGVLHRDISINNLMINEDRDNPSWPSFLIDLDLAIREDRDHASGAKGKTGTRAFIAIGALLGEQHSFMHDLESFFWVLFWICIHYDGPGGDVGPTEFEGWNYESDDKLADLKKGQVSDGEDFTQRAEKYFTPFYRPLIPWVNRLRREVFPNGERWKRAEPNLYYLMTSILRDAREDAEVLADA
ncbi:hypothetical protein B0T17DRAFT_490701 [Bombardia bombarda]|uniref:non-specific serine/threonine protein kinase n=1 Tax=Bombardia bombarda TaxID=252184 RepID=A0AA40C7J2_9PEZI|nr:hypothetical protein B0T17DRAFT_490701 [Bombardia bombarda]